QANRPQRGGRTLRRSRQVLAVSGDPLASPLLESLEGFIHLIGYDLVMGVTAAVEVDDAAHHPVQDRQGGRRLDVVVRYPAMLVVLVTFFRHTRYGRDPGVVAVFQRIKTYFSFRFITLGPARFAAVDSAVLGKLFFCECHDFLTSLQMGVKTGCWLRSRLSA